MTGKEWGSKELQILKQNYLLLNKQELMQLFKPHARSWLSVYKKAYKLGLHRPSVKDKVDSILKERYYNTELTKLLAEVKKFLPYISEKALRARGQRLGLTRREFANFKSRKNVKLPTPSKELAWFLGVLAGDGHVSQPTAKGNSYAVTLITVDKGFAAKFRAIGRKLFLIDPSWRVYNKYKLKGKWRKYYECRFLSKTLVEYFGDWREDVWPQTLVTKFDWVMKDKVYLAQFLSGYFDSDGSIQKNYSKAYRISIAVKNATTQSFVRNMFSRLDINSVIYVKGVWINGFDKCAKAAEHIFSCIPRKKKLLKELTCEL